MAQWYNNDGLLVRSGQDEARETKSVMAEPRTAGGLKHMVVDINFDDLPTFTTDSDNDGTNDAFSGQDNYIPAGSFITRAIFVVETAFAGGTSYDIGLYDEDGTVIDVDGIVDAMLLAEIDDDVNNAHVCDGDLVGGILHIGAANGYLVVTEAGTFTAGKGKLLIEYLPVGVGADITV